MQPVPVSSSPASRPSFGVLEKFIFVLPILFAVGFYWLRSTHRMAYYSFVREDGPAEDFQAVMLLGAAICSGLTARVFFRAHERLLGAAYLLLAVMIFCVFGEEISWGQRIVGWQSTGYFATENVQKETNLHNDAHIREFLDVSVLAASMFGALTSLLSWSFLKRGAVRCSFFGTDLPTFGLFLVSAAIYTVYHYLNPIIRPYYHGFDVFLWQDLEMAETFFATGVFCTVLLKLRAARHFFGRTVVEEAPLKSSPVPRVQT